MMFKIVCYTQILENYGDEERPRWKAKGGHEYIVARLPLAQVCRCSQSDYEAIIGRYRAELEGDGSMFQEWILDWELMPDFQLTQFEQDQLEYEGRIAYRPTELTA